MSRDGDDDDTVGYGKPPKKTRFKEGCSGNPKGRPKGSRNFDKDLDDVLGSKITVTENGRKKSVSAQLAALMRLREKALKGDGRALNRLLSMADERSAERAAHSKERNLYASEEDILQRYVESLGSATNGEDQGDGE
ncbi:hypothetical protein SuNHUV7_41070 (plasmid) [Pseudoseohaeicola sp. NH-UV-7]|jgi:hypothetical protein|uniref:DUF5681 domain-containing protein n=1 Tax=Sulfitobacter sp. TBRI5 TaxID=2989732 RepID=UPI003A71CD77